MNQAIVFDLDGTLWDSVKGCTAAWNEVLCTLPDVTRTITEEELRSYMGKTVHEIGLMMLKEVPEERAMEIMALCAEHEHEYLLTKGGARLYDSLLPTLNALQKQYDLCIVSNCESGYIEVFLQAFQLEACFADHLCAGDSGLSKGENIRTLIQKHHYQKAIYVGDTLGDEQAANAAGVPFVHAAYGFGTAQEPAAILTRITDLTAAAAELLP